MFFLAFQTQECEGLKKRALPSCEDLKKLRCFRAARLFSAYYTFLPHFAANCTLSLR